MKKNILYTVLLSSFALIVSACGTNSKSDGAASTGGTNASDIVPSITCFYDPDADEGPVKYVLYCYVHTVDSNSNPINGLEYKVSVITNVKTSNTNGTILTTEPITFSDDAQTFVQSNIMATDTLIVLPTEDTTDVSYLGNWQISSVNSNTNITLQERAFNLETTEGLSYVIGSETRYDLGGTASAHIEYSDGNSTLNSVSDEGLFYFNLVFDAQLTDQTIILGAYSGENRIGTATYLTLVVEEPEEEEETTE
jgi:hypothetical protein